MKNETPLHYAAEKNSEEMKELLISKGAYSDVSDIIIYLDIYDIIICN